MITGESEGQAIHMIDNCQSRFTVAPRFSGALTRWEEDVDRVNHVMSSFPEHRTLGWISPWYGGVTPIAALDSDGDFPGKLDRETLIGQVANATDTNGIPWRGVRLSCDLTREEHAGLQVDLDYLTVGHSNLLKLIYRVRNTTTAKRRLVIGWMSFWQPDGDSKLNVLRSEDIQRKSTPWNSEPLAYCWGAVTNPETERTVVLTSPYPEVRLMDWGDDAGHLGWWSSVDVMPLGLAERVCYLVLCADLAEARRYRWLGQYTAR